jgi:toxin FitB
MFVLDTNVVSELRRPEKASPKAVAWSLSLPLASFFLSAITVLELELGVLLIERKDKGAVVDFALVDRRPDTASL